MPRFTDVRGDGSPAESTCCVSTRTGGVTVKTDVIRPVGGVSSVLAVGGAVRTLASTGVSSVLTVGGMARSCLRTRSTQLDVPAARESSDRDISALPDTRVHVVAVRWTAGTLLRV